MATREGVTVLRVRYHSDRLAQSIVEKGTREIDLRWDAEDIDEIEACIDWESHAMPAVHDGFDGPHAQIWITARRSLRTTSPQRQRWEADVVEKAITAKTSPRSQFSSPGSASSACRSTFRAMMA